MSTWTMPLRDCEAFARNNNRGLTEVAEGLVAGTVSVDGITQVRRPRRLQSRQL